VIFQSVLDSTVNCVQPGAAWLLRQRHAMVPCISSRRQPRHSGHAALLTSSATTTTTTTNDEIGFRRCAAAAAAAANDEYHKL